MVIVSVPEWLLSPVVFVLFLNILAMVLKVPSGFSPADVKKVRSTVYDDPCSNIVLVLELTRLFP